MIPHPTDNAPMAVSGATANGAEPVETQSVEVAPRPAAVEAKQGGPSTVLWLTRGDELFIATVLGLTLVWTGGDYLQSRWAGPVLPIEHVVASDPKHLVDVNSADWIELSTLDAVGPELARRIVADRQTQGPFQTVDDLIRVKGIGKKTLEKVRPFVVARPTLSPDGPSESTDGTK